MVRVITMRSAPRFARPSFGGADAGAGGKDKRAERCRAKARPDNYCRKSENPFRPLAAAGISKTQRVFRAIIRHRLALQPSLASCVRAPDCYFFMAGALAGVVLQKGANEVTASSLSAN